MTVIGCPTHPGHKMLAYQQSTFATPCTIFVNEGAAEIELDPMGEFVRDMETTTIIQYLCSVDGCPFVIIPEQLPVLVAKVEADKAKTPFFQHDGEHKHAQRTASRIEQKRKEIDENTRVPLEEKIKRGLGLA